MRLNEHGDRLIETTGSHGADIAAQRLDELDRRALQVVLERGDADTCCVEYGCAAGWQGLRFALLGAEVHLYDLLPAREPVAPLLGRHPLRIEHSTCDLATLGADDLPPAIDLAFSQRALHYLRAADARRLIAITASRMRPGARFFVSVSGIDSELGHGYPARDAPIDERFARLAAPARSKHGIDAPLCLYAEAELPALMRTAGFDEVAVWRSPFGNVKGDFRWPGHR